MKAPVFEEKIVDYVIGQSNVSEKIVSIEELYSFDDDKKPAKKAAKKSTAKAESKSEEKETKKSSKKSA